MTNKLGVNGNLGTRVGGMEELKYELKKFRKNNNSALKDKPFNGQFSVNLSHSHWRLYLVHGPAPKARVDSPFNSHKLSALQKILKKRRKYA